MEPIKNSDGYGYVRAYLTRQINRVGAADPRPALAALERHRRFVIDHARQFHGLAKLGERWSWIDALVKHIRGSRPPQP